MIHYRNVDNWKLINYQGHNIKEVHSSLGKVWPTTSPTFDGKFKLLLNNGRTTSAECNSFSSITSTISKTYSGTLASAEIGSCVNSIDDSAFRTCLYLSSITISDSVTNIGADAFAGCQSLSSITIPDSVTSIGERAFLGSYALSSITIPDSVTNLSNSVFYGCSGLTSCLIGSGVTNIQLYTFHNCIKLQNMVIPSGITNIGAYAFNNCSGLTAITCLATEPPALGGSAFYNTNNCPIYVPCQSITQYKSAWSTYASRIQCIEPYGERYLTFVAEESGTFSFEPLNSNVIEYSKNGGAWTQGNSVSVQTRDTVLWKGEMTPASSSPSFGVGTFSSTSSFKAEGNPMSLFYGESFKGQTNLSGKSHAFHGLFKNCTKLTSIENLELEATTLEQSCYAEMFQGCTSLSAVSMNLLPATTLTNGCYNNMFYGCSSLTSVVNLQAMTLAKNCYNGMYAECTSLTTVNKLPSTTLAEWCYHYMFEGCTSLTTVPTDMLLATTLPNGCYAYMFKGCTELTTAPELLANTLVEYCYNAMFENCSKLNNIKCLATSINGTNTTTNWIKNVASSGTFTKATSMNSWDVCNTAYYNGIPCNWNVQDE